MWLGIRTYSSGVHTSGTVPRKHITWMLRSRPCVCNSPSQMRWGSGSSSRSCTCRGDLPACLSEGSTARKQWRWMTLSSCLTDVWLSTPPLLFPFHQRPLIIPSTERPKAVPTAALLNAIGIHQLPPLSEMILWKLFWLESRTGEGILAVLALICIDHWTSKQQFPCVQGLISFRLKKIKYWSN